MYAGLKVNVDKTGYGYWQRYLTTAIYTEDHSLDITVEGQAVSQVSNFKYLRVILSSDGTIDKELTAHVQKATGAFNKLNNIWNSCKIRTPTKIRIYKAAVLTTLLYGEKVWNTTQKQIKRFSVFHLRCLRRILRIKWYHKIRNEIVLMRAEIMNIEVYVSAMRLSWYGHVVRMPQEELPNYLVEWVPKHGKRSRGRPRKSWINLVRKDLSSFADLTLDKMSEMATKRTQWRGLGRSSQRTSPDFDHFIPPPPICHPV